MSEADILYRRGHPFAVQHNFHLLANLPIPKLPFSLSLPVG